MKGEKAMQKFIMKPCIDLYEGVVVDKDTVLEYSNEVVEQKLEGLVFHSVTKAKGESYESVLDTTIHLNEGDILLFLEDGRGYIKPVESFVTVAEAIDDLTNIKDLG